MKTSRSSRRQGPHQSAENSYIRFVCARCAIMRALAIGVQRTRSTSFSTGYRVETTRAMMSSTVTMTSQIGSARCFVRSNVRLVGTVRDLPARKDHGSEQQRGRGVADHHQDPVAIEWNGRIVRKEIAANR